MQIAQTLGAITYTLCSLEDKNKETKNKKEGS